jgi:hypothetical protein
MKKQLALKNGVAIGLAARDVKDYSICNRIGNRNLLPKEGFV